MELRTENNPEPSFNSVLELLFFVYTERVVESSLPAEIRIIKTPSDAPKPGIIKVLKIVSNTSSSTLMELLKKMPLDIQCETRNMAIMAVRELRSYGVECKVCI